MISRTIEIDEASDERLRDLLESTGGDMGIAIRELLESRDAMEKMAEEAETGNEALIRFQLADSERTFLEGRGIPCEVIKERNHL